MMLGQGRLPHDEAQAGLAAIGDAADQLERVIARLLEVAGRRADGGRPGGGRPGDEQPPEASGTPAPVQVRQVVDSVVRRWKAREGPRHPLTRRIARELPGLAVDRRRLEESLDELVDNAVKFSPEGSRILVAARLVDAAGSDGDGSGPAVEISVDDLGIGIATDELSRIFDDFTQADSTATRSFGGLGLGLSVVRRTVEAYDGELVCETEQGKGSRFSIILPVTPIPDGENR
jgi:signal transduction histidine kinase